MDNNEVVQTNDRMCMVPVVRDGEEKPCGFMANGKGGLAIHQRFIHGIAGKYAANRAKIEKRRKANKGKMKQCPYCDFETYHQSSYVRHQRQRHPNETGFARIGERALEKLEQERNAKPVSLRDRIAELVAEKIYNKLMS